MTTDFSSKEWTFLEPQNVAVFTTYKVVSENHPILYVCHDDDGVWQFHTGADVNEEGSIPLFIILMDNKVLAS